jgi:hypothetical protein
MFSLLIHTLNPLFHLLANVFSPVAIRLVFDTPPILYRQTAGGPNESKNSANTTASTIMEQ